LQHTSDLIPKVIWRVAWEMESGGCDAANGEPLVVIEEVVEDLLVFFFADVVSHAEEVLDLCDALADSYRRFESLGLVELVL
jgi:hypothetical protein